MEENELFKVSLLIAWLINVSIPLMLIFLQEALSFWTRGNFFIDLFKTFQNLKSKLVASDMEDDPWCFFWLMDVCAAAVVCIVSGILYNCFGVNPLYVLAVTLLVAFGPRFVIDMFKAVGMDSKTGNAERISALEEELGKLKGKK